MLLEKRQYCWRKDSGKVLQRFERKVRKQTLWILVYHAALRALRFQELPHHPSLFFPLAKLIFMTVIYNQINLKGSFINSPSQHLVYIITCLSSQQVYELLISKKICLFHTSSSKALKKTPPPPPAPKKYPRPITGYWQKNFRHENDTFYKMKYILVKTRP